MSLPADCYESWRQACAPRNRLREADTEETPTEQLLQQIWRHQRLNRGRLRLTDGRTVIVLHPGFGNREAGPDFRRALLRLGGGTPVSGDVEVDLRADGWTQHGHAGNPAFSGVRLHVVWSPPARTVSDLPTLALRDQLDAPLETLAEELSGVVPDQLPAGQEGACAARFAALTETQRAGLLEQAALVRLRVKAGRWEARARQAGWEAALWEALFTALGYKHNVWPMRRLAELLPRLRPEKPDPLAWQARLLGVAGLLPRELSRRRAETDLWLRTAWDHWWREQAALADVTLPPRAWRLAGVRPANHPQRRLALAAHWLCRPDLPAALEAWLWADLPANRWVATLHRCLQPEPDPFWEHHWNLRATPLPQPCALLGPARVTDLALNAVLPWLWSRARAGMNAAARRRVEERCRAWPAAQDNAVLRLARQRLLAGVALPRPRRAAHQQGLLQWVADFCQTRDARCTGCPLPVRLAALERRPK